MLEEVDEIDAQNHTFITGRQSEPQQPQLLRARTLAAKARHFVALVDSRQKVCDSM